jgi:hypothetical protein
MVSCMLLSHGSQAVQTSRFSAARVPMDTCGMSYIKRFWNCNFVICTIKYTHLCIRHRDQTSAHNTTSLINKKLPYSSRMHPHRLNLGGGRLLLRNCPSSGLPLSVCFAPFQSDIPEASTRVFSLSLWMSICRTQLAQATVVQTEYTSGWKLAI